jgi:hypothetical protein
MGELVPLRRGRYVTPDQRRNPSQHYSVGGGGGVGGSTSVTAAVGPMRDLPGVIIVRVGYSEPVQVVCGRGDAGWVPARAAWAVDGSVVGRMAGSGGGGGGGGGGIGGGGSSEGAELTGAQLCPHGGAVRVECS